MLTRFATAALAAGIAAGIVVSGVQAFTTTPLIIEAERYEDVAMAGDVWLAALEDETTATDMPLMLADSGHGADGHDEGGWAPEDGFERTLFTSISSIGTMFGFALLLLGAMVLAGERIDARRGLMWGAAAFVAAGLAPALGLSPELPGSAAAALDARQFWWFGTVVATAAGLYLALKVSSLPAIVGGIALIVAPHLFGPPHPQAFTSRVPSELASHFASASLAVHAIGWAIVGVVLGHVWERLGRDRGTAAA